MRPDALTLTVSELNALVRDRIESDLRFADLAVLGELSNYKVYPSGHHYFTLKDQDSSLRCVMFRSSAVRLRFRPENGMKVCALGALRVYQRDGAYQLYCSVPSNSSRRNCRRKVSLMKTGKDRCRPSRAGSRW